MPQINLNCLTFIFGDNVAFGYTESHRGITESHRGITELHRGITELL